MPVHIMGITSQSLLSGTVGDDNSGRVSLGADKVVLVIATSVAVGWHVALTPETDTKGKETLASVALLCGKRVYLRSTKLVVKGQAELIITSSLLNNEAVLGV